MKRCSKCRKWKDRQRDFIEVRVKRKTRKGTKIYTYPAAQCKECSKKRIAEYKKKLKEKGEFESAQARWEANRNREHQRRNHRERYRMARGEAFTHPWNRYKHEIDLGKDEREFSSCGVAEYLEKFLTYEPAAGGDFYLLINGVRLTDTEVHVFRRWQRSQPKLVTVRQIDIWSNRFDLPFWEMEEAGKMVA